MPQKDVWNPGGKLNPGFPEQQGHGQHQENVDTAFCTVCSKTAMGKITEIICILYNDESDLTSFHIYPTQILDLFII